MIRRPPRSTRTDTLFPYTTLFRSCKRSCPVVRMGKLCIEVTAASKSAFISEELCIGCGICAKKCPFGAITIINLPKDLERNITHRYGPTSFRLHRLPMPRPGQVLGLVGTNGIGQSTALKIIRSEERRVGKECVSTRRSRWTHGLNKQI